MNHLRDLTLDSTRPYLLALAALLACAGQAVLLRTVPDTSAEGARQILAGILLIAGGLLFGGLALQGELVLPRFEFPREGISRPASFWRSLWTLGLPLPAIFLALVATVLLAWTGESRTVVVIWLAGILALLVAQLERAQFTRPRLAPGERTYLALLGLPLIAALVTRVYKLTTLPYNVDGDFAAVGLQARALTASRAPYIFAYGWADVPILGYMPPWLTMKLFGTGLAGLNASGVAQGLLIIVGVYLLGRDLFQPRVGLMAATLLTVSYTHLAASRQSSYIDPVFFLVFAIYFLLVGLREGRGWAIATSGVLTALCVQMYYSGRIVVFIIGFIFLFILIFRPPWLQARGWAVLLWVVAVLITLGPMLVAFTRLPEYVVEHTRAVFILDPAVIQHMQWVYHVDTLPAMLLQQARHAALMFHYYPDTGTQFGLGRPFLDPFTAVLFTLGAGFALFHARRFGNALLLAWTVLGVLLGCFLTVNPPFWARLMILLPLTALLAALALDLLYERVKAGLERIPGRAALIAPAAAALLIAGMGVSNWSTYVEVKATFATPRTRIARYLADEPPAARAYLVSDPYKYDDREFAFLAPGRLVAKLTPEQVHAPIPPIGSPTLLILTREQKALLPQLQQRFPGGTVETHPGNEPGEVAFYVFRLP